MLLPIATAALLLSIVGCSGQATVPNNAAANSALGWGKTANSALRSGKTMYGYFHAAGYAYWNPVNPYPAYNKYEAKFKVLAMPLPTNNYWYSVQNGFVGGDAFDMGLQTFGPCPGPSGECPIALFNFGGSDAVSWAPNCSGGSGIVICSIEYNFTAGRVYALTATESAVGSTETWTGTVTDVAAKQTMTIGSWTIPASDGLIGTTGLSFSTDVTGSPLCDTEVYSKVDLMAPTGYSGKKAFKNTLASTETGSDCASFTKVKAAPNHAIVSTGNRH